MLKNTLYRLTRNKKLTIGYFGGSITEGAGASDPSKPWRALMTAWFRKQYPDCEITEIQAAIGGTGTELGVFRCERDLTSKKPDLVFMEFSINDSGLKVTDILANSEAIIRKIYAANPYCEIVYVHTTSRDYSGRLEHGSIFSSRAAHAVVMEHYHIPQLDIGEILRTRVLTEFKDWSAVLKDSVHPNDTGYSIYGETLISFVKGQLQGEPEESLIPAILPEPISTENRETARLENACEAISDAAGWTKTAQSLCGRYDNYIEATVPGSGFEYRFTGRCIGLYVMMAADSGDLYYRIDGGSEQMYRTWDGFCKRFNRAFGKILAKGLADGEHTLFVRVGAEKAEESLGTAVRIGAFMVW